MYRLDKRVISQFVRTGCRRRLRLDLYQSSADRRLADAPEKDARRPGLALLTQQGRQYERAKYLELEEFFPDLLVRGGLKEFDAGQDRTFHEIALQDCIGRLREGHLALEAEYEVTESLKAAHGLEDLEDGTAVCGRERMTFGRLRPDIIQVREHIGKSRRTVTPSGHLEEVPAEDQRLGLRVIDIKISGEPSPAHFAELAYYCMALSAWIVDRGFADRFVVLAEAAVWPGAHEGSTMRRLQAEDRRSNVPVLDRERYLEGFEADLETMPPEVVLGRVRRFLQVDLREALAETDWRRLPWHVDHRCSGCDYLGYRWSGDRESSGAHAPEGETLDARYCWPMAEQTGHLSRVAGLTEGASGKLREADVPDVRAASELPAGSPAFDSHQTLRAKRTVLSARAATLRDGAPANIPSLAGTSAALPRFSDIRIGVSADFDVGSGLTFAFGYRIDYGVPEAELPNRPTGPRYGRRSGTIERPLLVLDRSLEAEGATLRNWLDHLVQDIVRVRDEAVAGYRVHGNPDKADATIQFFLWDRLTFDHLCRVFGRHLDRLQRPVQGTDVSPMAWVFPSERVLGEPTFVARSSPITTVSDAVNGLVAAPVPHHYGIIDLANSLDPESRVFPNGESWSFGINRFYRDPLSDQIPSERATRSGSVPRRFPTRTSSGTRSKCATLSSASCARSCTWQSGSRDGWARA